MKFLSYPKNGCIGGTVHCWTLTFTGFQATGLPEPIAEILLIQSMAAYAFCTCFLAINLMRLHSH
jgi:hypothetical protein